MKVLEIAREDGGNLLAGEFLALLDKGEEMLVRQEPNSHDFIQASNNGNGWKVQALKPVFITGRYPKKNNKLYELYGVYLRKGGWRSLFYRQVMDKPIFRAAFYHKFGESDCIAIVPILRHEVIVPTSRSGKYGWITTKKGVREALRELPELKDSGKHCSFYYYDAGSPRDGHSSGMGWEIPDSLPCYNRGRDATINQTKNVSYVTITFDTGSLRVVSIDSYSYGEGFKSLCWGHFDEYHVSVGKRLPPAVRNQLEIGG